MQPIATPGPGYAAPHGSVWDYDRRVPIIFWRPGYPAQNIDLPAQTVDILPSVAAMIGLPLASAAIDGKCLPQAPGAACPAR